MAHAVPGGRTVADGHAVPDDYDDYAVLGDAVPDEHAVRGDVVSDGRAVPGHSVPGHAVPQQAARERAVPEHTVPERTVPEQVVPGDAERSRPAAAESAQPSSSEDDWAAFGYTPATGFPLNQLRVGAPGDAPWPDRMRTLLRTPMSERPAFERSTVLEPSEVGPNVPRILDLTLRIGELLLASGESAEDVEAAILGVSHAYGLDRCEPQVTFTLMSISYQPSLVEPPVSASRVVRRRGTDYTRLGSVYRLVADITGERTNVEEAYRRLAEIRRNRHPYAGWLLSLATGLLAGSATLLVGGSADSTAWLVVLAAFTASVIGDRLAWALASRGLPEFYQFVVAAMPAAGMGVLLTLSDTDLRGSVVITGGLFALLPGRALVAAVADGLTGYYITAAARLLEVIYLVVGIVLGVLLVLYVGVRSNASLHPEETFAATPFPALQLLAAMALTLSFAVLLQTSRRVLPVVTLLGGVGWAVFGVLTVRAGISPIIATGVASGTVGLFGQLASRYRYSSSLPYVTAALGPLMPGSVIYVGLLSLAQGEPLAGLVSISRATETALALAIGVNLGGEVARLFLRVPASDGPASGRRAAKRTRGF